MPHRVPHNPAQVTGQLGSHDPGQSARINPNDLGATFGLLFGLLVLDNAAVAVVFGASIGIIVRAIMDAQAAIKS